MKRQVCVCLGAGVPLHAVDIGKKGGRALPAAFERREILQLSRRAPPSLPVLVSGLAFA